MKNKIYPIIEELELIYNYENYKISEETKFEVLLNNNIKITLVDNNECNLNKIVSFIYKDLKERKWKIIQKKKYKNSIILLFMNKNYSLPNKEKEFFTLIENKEMNIDDNSFFVNNLQDIKQLKKLHKYKNNNFIVKTLINIKHMTHTTCTYDNIYKKYKL